MKLLRKLSAAGSLLFVTAIPVNGLDNSRGQSQKPISQSEGTTDRPFAGLVTSKCVSSQSQGTSTFVDLDKLCSNCSVRA